MKDGMYLPAWLSGCIAASYLAAVIFSAYCLFQTLSTASNVETATFLDSIRASATSGIAFSSLFYIRKLYRDLFAGLSKKADGVDAVALATFLYFISRPIFAAAISCLFVVAMFESIRAFSQGQAGINASFVFFSAISSALIATATGAAINRLEEMARSGHSFFRPPM